MIDEEDWSGEETTPLSSAANPRQNNFTFTILSFQNNPDIQYLDSPNLTTARPAAACYITDT